MIGNVCFALQVFFNFCFAFTPFALIEDTPLMIGRPHYTAHAFEMKIKILTVGKLEVMFRRRKIERVFYHTLAHTTNSNKITSN